MEAGCNRKVQSPPFWLYCMEGGYNKKSSAPFLRLDCVGAAKNRKVQLPPLRLDMIASSLVPGTVCTLLTVLHCTAVDRMLLNKMSEYVVWNLPEAVPLTTKTEESYTLLLSINDNI